MELYRESDGMLLFETDLFTLRFDSKWIYKKQPYIAVVKKRNDACFGKLLLVAVSFNEDGSISLKHRDKALLDALKEYLTEHEGMVVNI